MAKVQHKCLVTKNYPGAKLKFYRGLGYCIEVDGAQLSAYHWSPVNAWAQADLRPIFKAREKEVHHGA